jgi:zinc transporter 9
MNISSQNSTRVSGFLPVIFALIGNFFIAILKFIGFFISGSGALFSEAIHSLADTLNQGLLMVGLKLSTKKADEEFSYGYGQERFLWALISACGIFFLGAGVTIYHGVSSFIAKEEPHISSFVFIILIISFIIESFTLAFAWRDLKKNNKDKSFLDILSYGDPTTIAVLLEDFVAVIGVVIAFSSILLTKITGNFYWDAAGSIIIGVLLGIVAVLLIRKNRDYLIGKNIPEEMKEKIIEIMESNPTIEKVLDFKSSVLDVNQYQIKCEVEFNGSALMRKIYKDDNIKKEYEMIKNDYGEFTKFLVDYIDKVPRLIGSNIDEIEKKIQKEVPEIKHIDIEIN